MSAHDLAIPGADRSSVLGSRRLLVTRQDENRMYRPVGFLDALPGPHGTSYSFAYLRAAIDAPGFRPLLGFSDVRRRYESLGLFPLFAERIMDPRRPDRPAFLAALDLSADAGPLAILERSGGHRLGDGIELLPVPSPTPEGSVTSTLLVHGIRHVEGAEEAVATLTVGRRLVLEPQPDNPWNPRAILVTVDEPSRRLGWIPNAFVDVVHQLTSADVTVVRVNGPEVGPRFRLLVRVDGVVDAAWSPYAGPAWETAA